MLLNHKISAITLALALMGCGNAPHAELDPTPSEDRPKLGLMSSLPLYWPLDADIHALASDEAELPWQRTILEQRFELLPLDTLTPIPALDLDAPPSDPLADLERLAVVQPRGITAGDNVAMDEWVRGGGQLLLVLDPYLTGYGRFALDDPRQPVASARIPPVLARWGLEIVFDETQPTVREADLNGTALPLVAAGDIREIAGSSSDCRILAQGVLAQCAIGEGRVTLMADATAFADPGNDGNAPSNDEAAPFEHPARTAAIQALVAFAFEEG